MSVMFPQGLDRDFNLRWVVVCVAKQQCPSSVSLIATVLDYCGQKEATSGRGEKRDSGGLNSGITNIP